MAAKVDPVVIRKLLTALSGVDSGANPTYADLQSFFNTSVHPIIPVFPVTNSKNPIDVNIQTSSATVTTTGTVTQQGFPIPASGQTIIAATGNATMSTSYTTIASVAVPSGKTAYITDIVCGFTGNTTATFTGVQVQDGTTVYFELRNQATAATSPTHEYNVHLETPLSIAGNVTVTLQGIVQANAGTAYAYLGGWYQ